MTFYWASGVKGLKNLRKFLVEEGEKKIHNDEFMLVIKWRREMKTSKQTQ